MEKIRKCYSIHSCGWCHISLVHHRVSEPLQSQPALHHLKASFARFYHENFFRPSSFEPWAWLEEITLLVSLAEFGRIMLCLSEVETHLEEEPWQHLISDSFPLLCQCHSWPAVRVLWGFFTSMNVATLPLATQTLGAFRH